MQNSLIFSETGFPQTEQVGKFDFTFATSFLAFFFCFFGENMLDINRENICIQTIIAMNGQIIFNIKKAELNKSQII